MSINVTKLFELEIGSKNPFPSFLEANYFLLYRNLHATLCFLN